MRLIISADIAGAVSYLRKGEVVAIPTETVYGLAANALDAEAVAKIFAVKERPSFDPLIVHTSSIERAEQLVVSFPDELRKLAEKFWPGPLTLLLPKRDLVPDLVNSGLDRVGVRVPNHPLTLKLLQQLDFPLAAPSANPFGYISPTSAAHVETQLGERIPFILDGGACTVGVESTIVGMEDDTVIVYRVGGLSIEEIEEVLGLKVGLRISSSKPSAPGMLISHYAPKVRLVVGNIKENLKAYEGSKIGIISFRDKYEGVDVKHHLQLSSKGDLTEAAARLFSALRELDVPDELDLILAEPVPDEGLGRAINDRLRRAAAE